MAFPDLDDLPGPVRDLLDVTVGLGLLTFQRAQVQRRAFEKQIEKIEPELPDPARSVARNVRAVSETVGEGLARLLIPGPSGPTSVRHEPTRPTPAADAPQAHDHSPGAGSPDENTLDIGVEQSPLDNHLDGTWTSPADDSDHTLDGRVDPEPNETHEG